ncbi:MAG: hypothetical protein NVS9B15_01700 [Acidobacteriaceae bacterium]
MTITCRETKSLFTPYMDGMVPGAKAQLISRHLDSCSGCNQRFSSMRSTQTAVATLGRRQPPPELANRLRFALAKERERRQEPVGRKISLAWNPVRDRLEQTMRSFMLPATAGVLSAVLCFGFLVGLFAVPLQLSADDIPSGLFTPAKLAFAPFLVQDNCGPDSPVMVEAYVDSFGRVQDYRIVSSEPETSLPELRQQLDNALLYAQFEPAIAFGKPSPSRVVVSFSRVNVHA